MEITTNRLIQIALDNLKRKLAAAVPLGEPIHPAALEKLPGAIREVVNTLHGRGIQNVYGEDVLAEARTDLASRLAGSLQAGMLLPNEITPEIVKWLAGTPLAAQIANRIRPSGRRKMAGGEAAMAAAGPVAILTNPPGESGPVYILSKPPGGQSGKNGPINIITNPPEDSGPIHIISRPTGDQAGNNGPIGIITRPPGDTGPIYIISRPTGDQAGDNGPVSILSKPPEDHPETATPIYIVARPPSEGSSGGSKKVNPRLRWLLPAGLIAVIILFLAGWLAGSIGKDGRPAPTPTVGLAVGVGGKTYTVTPSDLSGSSPADTPSITATSSPTATGTLTATLTWTETPTATATPAPFFLVVVEPKHIYYRGTGCGEMKARFQVQVAEPAKVAGVWMFVRLINQEATEVTGWSGALVMAAEGSGWYGYTLFAEDIPEYTKYREARVLYQLVAYDSHFTNVAASGVHGDVDLSACGM